MTFGWYVANFSLVHTVTWQKLGNPVTTLMQLSGGQIRQPNIGNMNCKIVPSLYAQML